jgi:hypothetical protein
MVTGCLGRAICHVEFERRLSKAACEGRYDQDGRKATGLRAVGPGRSQFGGFWHARMRSPPLSQARRD